MSHFEDQLRACQLDTPHPEWRGEILALCRPPPPTRWQDWLWPSPLAWAALVMLWSGLGLATPRESAGVSRPPTVAARPLTVSESPLFAFQTTDPFLNSLSSRP